MLATRADGQIEIEGARTRKFDNKSSSIALAFVSSIEPTVVCCVVSCQRPSASRKV